MKPIVALMITGLLASTAALAQEGKPAPETPAATTPSGAESNGDHPAKKAVHHKRKKHKAPMTKAEGDTKSGMKAPTESTMPATSSYDTTTGKK
jgi:hypothetical protein